jgi:RNA polymerase sigma-70 factor (ECF subfamily)
MAAALEHVATREDAEDVVQETFRRVVDSIARFDAARGFAPWFFTILRNTARNVAKRQHLRAHVALVDEMPSSEPGPYETTRRHEIRHRIGLAVDRLPAMQQTCFRLCMVEGLTSVEAANALGLAESTVRVHLFHARRSLQVLLGDWREEAEDA